MIKGLVLCLSCNTQEIKAYWDFAFRPRNVSFSAANMRTGDLGLLPHTDVD
jgi:hypothetical protein